MKLYILRWNPNFSMKYTYFNSMMDYLRENEIDTFDWSIYDHEEGDMFILVQVGTGIYDGTNRFYAKMSMHCLISPNKLVYENYNEGETIDKSLVEISEKKFGRVKLSKDSSEEDFTRFFVPVA